ncbi:MAG: hypothetical protein NVS2B9_09850 [Myxococcales bacterium]
MNIKKIKSQGLKALESVQDFDRDDLLEALALQERNPPGAILGGFGIFLLGALVGAGLGLAFAPKAGKELLSDLGEAARRKADELANLDGPGGSPEPLRSSSSLT